MSRYLLLFSLTLFAACGSHETTRISGKIASESAPTEEDRSESGLMVTAISGGDLGKVQELLAKGFPLETLLAKKRTPLLEAIAWNRRLIVEFLLNQGADPKAKDEEGKDAFSLCAGNINLEQTLDSQLRARIEAEVFLAVQKADAALLKRALEQNFANPNAENSEGETPLTLAIKLKANAAFRPLFQKRANTYLEIDLNKRNRAGESPLFLARQGKISAVESHLVKNGAKE